MEDKNRYLGLGVCASCREEIIYTALLKVCPECQKPLVLYSFMSAETLRSFDGARVWEMMVRKAKATK